FRADPRLLTPDSHPLRRALPLFLLAGVCFSTLDATAKWLVRDHTLFLVVATACFFGALRFLPLAEASAITFLAPMFAIFLSMPVLGEKPTRARWIAAIVGFAGILILVRPGAAAFHPAAALLVLAALANALYQLLTRKLPKDNPYTTLFYSALVGTAVL